MMRTTLALCAVISCGMIAACTAQPPTPDEAPQTVHAELGDPFAAPADAEDLDPADDIVRYQLVADELEGDTRYRYAFNGQNPAPTLRARVGDTVVVELTNQLAQPTTIHWHGVAVPWAMDGVTWMQDPIAPGETFTYEFQVNRAGTFWYHPHFNTANQVDGGLFGMLVVEDPSDPIPDTEVLLVIDSADEFLGDPDAVMGHGGGMPEDGAGNHFGHGSERVRRTWYVNGVEEPELVLPAGSTARVRILNASNTGYAALRWPRIRHIANDQGLLPSLQEPERLVLAPGDRADAEWLIDDDGFVVELDPYSLNGGDAYGPPRTLMTVVADGGDPAPPGLAWPFGGGEPTADPGSTDVLYAFAGSDRTGLWMINGEFFPDVTIAELELGQTAVIEVRNLSPTEHPFHLHGLHFEVLSVNAVAPGYRRVEDTINLKIRDVVRLLVTADNPGDWMAHCHILPHAEGGMMTVLRVGE